LLFKYRLLKPSNYAITSLTKFGGKMKLSLAILGLLISGCAFNVNLRKFDHITGAPPNVHQKRWAIILDPDKVPESIVHRATGDTDTYTYKGIAEGVEEGIKDRLTPSSVKVESYTSSKVPAGEKIDYYVYPEVAIRTVNDFWTLGCVVSYSLTIKDANNKTLAASKTQAKSNFFFPSQSDAKCQRALSTAFNQANDQALGQLR
jgi:hypothetical protein